VWGMVQDACAWAVTILGKKLKIRIIFTGCSAGWVRRIISSLASATCGAPAGTTPVRVSGSASSTATMPVTSGGISLRFRYPPHEGIGDLDIPRGETGGWIRTLNIVRAVNRDGLLDALRLTVLLIEQVY
jgi:hypothetical protein